MIRRVFITFATILGLLAATHGSVAFGAIRWGGDVLRQQPEWYGSAAARAVANSGIQYQSPQGGCPKSTDLATPPRSPGDVLCWSTDSCAPVEWPHSPSIPPNAGIRNNRPEALPA